MRILYRQVVNLMGVKEELNIYAVSLISFLITHFVDNYSSLAISLLTIIFMVFKIQKMYNEKRLAKSKRLEAEKKFKGKRTNLDKV